MMANVQTVLDNQKRIEDSLASRMAEIEKSLSAASSDGKPNIDWLLQEFRAFKEMALSTLKLLRTQIQSLDARVDDLDTYNRRNALLFNGVPEKDGEDCAALVLSVIHAMEFPNIKTPDFYLCHRLGVRSSKRTRPILVRFVEINTRNIIWREKKRLKSTPTVLSEFLTKSRQEIFAAARKHFGINRSWTRDGAIMIKLPNNDRKRIVNAEELDQVMSKFPSVIDKPAPEPTASVPQTLSRNAPSSSAAPEPPLTRRNIATRSRTNK